MQATPLAAKFRKLKMQRQAARKLLACKLSTPSEIEKVLVHTCKKRIGKPTIGSDKKSNKVYQKWTSSHILSRPSAIIQRGVYMASDHSPVCCNLINFHRKLGFSTCATQTAEPGGIIEVPLAQTGEGIADCELLSWLVKEGDDVDEFQPLCSVQSDKATIQITSRYKGRVSRLNFVPGDVIKVGESLLELLSGSIAQSLSKEESSDEESTSTSNESAGHVKDFNKRALAAPAVRELARNQGIKLEDVHGSGKDGRVLKEDVIKHLEEKASLNEEMVMVSNIVPKDGLNEEMATVSKAVTNDGLAAFPCGKEKPEHSVDQKQQEAVPNVHQPVDRDTIIHLRGYQRVMAKTMTAAAAIPHFYLVDELKLDALVELKEKLKDVFVEEGVKITFLPLMIKALSVALLKYPLLNSTCNEDASTICRRGSHNVGVAVATPHGLAVPNIKNVQRLSVLEIAKELWRLTQLASSNQLSKDNISDGTISVSNFGSVGGRLGFPLLNLPEVAIGAFGRIHKVPRFAKDGSMYPASLMNVTWAADHRVLDGATLASFCNEWKALVEEPEKLVLHLR